MHRPSWTDGDGSSAPDLIKHRPCSQTFAMTEIIDSLVNNIFIVHSDKSTTASAKQKRKRDRRTAVGNNEKKREHAREKPRR